MSNMKIGDKNCSVHWTSSVRPQTVVPIKTAMQTQELQFESILQNSPINAFKEVSKSVAFANVCAFRWYVSHSISSTSATINYYIFKTVHHSCCS